MMTGFGLSGLLVVVVFSVLYLRLSRLCDVAAGNCICSATEGYEILWNLDRTLSIRQ